MDSNFEEGLKYLEHATAELSVPRQDPVLQAQQRSLVEFQLELATANFLADIAKSLRCLCKRGDVE